MVKQINILSINALLKIARAREHGKVFEVVAEDSEKLTSKTSAAAQRNKKIADKAESDIKNIADAQGEVGEVIKKQSELLEEIYQVTEKDSGNNRISNKLHGNFSEI